MKEVLISCIEEILQHIVLIAEHQKEGYEHTYIQSLRSELRNKLSGIGSLRLGSDSKTLSENDQLREIQKKCRAFSALLSSDATRQISTKFLQHMYFTLQLTDVMVPDGD